MKRKQLGFGIVEIIVIILVLALLCFIGYYVYNANFGSDGQQRTNEAQDSTQSSSGKIKHLGVNIDYYDPATGKAGDFVFTKEPLHTNLLFMDYGYVISGSSTSTGQDKANPQPTFILPLGTKVYSLVDGTVFDTPKLYSNDYSVQVQPEGSDLIFETEHVINVTVKKGDKVKAGDVVAEVSPHDSQYNNGMGLVEIGILKGGNPPSHVCPFDYLDDSIKDDLLAKITALQKAWEEYKGDSSIYDESKVLVPGCVSRDPIEG